MKILFLYKKWLNDTDSLKEKTLSSKIKTKKNLIFADALCASATE